MSNTFHMVQEGQKLSAILEGLEQEAGLRERAEDARLGPLMPDLDASPDDYFDDVADHARRRLRDLYFDVADVSLRRRLIAADRALAAHHRAVLDADALGLREELAAARRATHRRPWKSAALVAAVCVFIGNTFAGLPGAIGGALVGFFFGQHMIADARASADEALSQAEVLMKENAADALRFNARPERFTSAEEETGERDLQFDRLSVYSNRTRT